MTILTRRRFLASTAALAAAGLARPAWAEPADELGKLTPLKSNDDLAKLMVDGLHKFLDAELDAAPERRKVLWKPDYSSVEAYNKSLEPKRERLRKIIGAVDERIKPVTMEYLVSGEPSRVSDRVAIAKGEGYQVFAVRWPVFEGVDGEGLLLQPDKEPVARVIALPDADWSPEQLVGLAPGVPTESQFAHRLAENGCQVLVPTLIDRKDTWSGNPRLGRMTNQPHREFIYRMAYELGRHIIGYEVQKVLAAVDWLSQQKGNVSVGVIGYGEGGLLALYSAALDARVVIAAVSGYFAPRTNLWEEPIDRNLWSLSREFDDAALASLVVPRNVLIELSRGTLWEGPTVRDGRSCAAPGRITPLSQKPTSEAESVWGIYRRLGLWPSDEDIKTKDRPAAPWAGLNVAVSGQAFMDPTTLRLFHGRLVGMPWPMPESFRQSGAVPANLRKNGDADTRLHRQFDQLVNHTQRQMRLAEERRQPVVWAKLNLKSLDEYKQSIEPLRKYFWEEVIGKLPEPTTPPNPKARPLHNEAKWKSYEVTLDLYPEVFAYGILCVPKDLKDGEKRPVVVCQHGLEGRPRDVVSPKEKTKYYNSFGSALADKGYVVFAPQNPYIFQNHFRQLQRKANPLGLSLFSFIVRQHERILNWLETLPFVDPKRMAFYGLSYGGKTAMRVPAILERYCLSICSGDFNEWIWKNASVDFKGSYMFTGEYEMYEFNLGNTFGYAEMAALIAPRPFMVERGHDDGVGIDEWIAYEYAKVRRLYAKLGIPDRTAIEFFNGGHEINGKGTFEFLQKHLGWPEKS
jgi:dienelactone hydrolase